MNILFGDKLIDIPTRNGIEFERVKFIIKERCVGRKWVPEKKYWYIPNNQANFNIIKSLLPVNIIKELESKFNVSIANLNKLTFLRDYQKEAVLDIIKGKKLVSVCTGGGKTFIALAYYKIFNITRGILIVPNPLKKQWQNEAKNHFGIESVIIEGTALKRKKLFDQALAENKMTIINYELARIMPELQDINFEFMVLDEGQKIKNNKTKTHKSLKSIKADQKIILTATPMINKPTDVFNIVNFMHPNFFDYYAFHERYVVYEDVWAGGGYIRTPIAFKNLLDLHEELKPIMIYKRKEDILSELPEKSYQQYWIEPTKEQTRLLNYYQILGEEILTSKQGNDYKQILACLTMMRRVSDSPELLSLSKSELSVIPQDNTAPKITILKEDIIPILDGKTIIFTEYSDMADILFRELQSFNPLIVKGGIDAQAVLDIFQKSTEHNILISTDVLNYGINLQFASNIVHYDLPWSPAKLIQRDGRIDRIGQTSKTLFISLITKDTVEEKVYNMLQDKKDMFNSTIEGGEQSNNDIIMKIFKKNK